MYSLTLGLVVVLAIVVVLLVARKKKPTPANAASSMLPVGGAAGAGCQSPLLQRIRMLGDDAGVRPGACRDEDGWMVYPTAWAVAPRYEIEDSPQRELTAAACQAFCESDPFCVSWVNNPKSYCHAYRVAPLAMVGNPDSTVGLRASRF